MMIAISQLIQWFTQSMNEWVISQEIKLKEDILTKYSTLQELDSRLVWHLVQSLVWSKVELSLCL